VGGGQNRRRDLGRAVVLQHVEPDILALADNLDKADRTVRRNIKHALAVDDIVHRRRFPLFGNDVLAALPRCTKSLPLANALPRRRDCGGTKAAKLRCHCNRRQSNGGDNAGDFVVLGRTACCGDRVDVDPRHLISAI
jgi:hypothetical protein